MRKAKLLTLLDNYYQELSDQSNPNIDLLADYLRLPEIANLPDTANIAFVDYYRFAIQIAPNILTSDFSGDLFNEFLAAEDNVINKSVTEKAEKSLGRFADLPSDMVEGHFIPNFDDETKMRLSATSSAFFNLLSKQDYWKYEPVKIGCDPVIMQQVIDSKSVTTFKDLYNAYKRCDVPPQSRWALLCMSGNVAAISEVLQIPFMSRLIKDGQNNMMDYIILSGKLHAIIFAENNNIPFNINKESYFLNALKTGNLDVINYVAKQLGDRVIKHILKHNNYQAYQNAGSSCSIPTIEWLLKKELEIFDTPRGDISDILYGALIRGTVEKITKVIKYLENNPEYKIALESVPVLELLHNAALSKRIDIIDFVVKEFGEPAVNNKAGMCEFVKTAAYSGFFPIFSRALEICDRSGEWLTQDYLDEIVLGAALGGNVDIFNQALKISQEKGYDVKDDYLRLLTHAIESQKPSMINRVLGLAVELGIQPELGNCLDRIDDISKQSVIALLLKYANEQLDGSTASIITRLLIAKAVENHNGPLIMAIRKECDGLKLSLPIDAALKKLNKRGIALDPVIAAALKTPIDGLELTHKKS